MTSRSGSLFVLLLLRLASADPSGFPGGGALDPQPPLAVRDSLPPPPPEMPDAPAAWTGPGRITFRHEGEGRPHVPARVGDAIALRAPAPAAGGLPGDPADGARGVATVTAVDGERATARIVRAFPGLERAAELRARPVANPVGANLGWSVPIGNRGSALLGLDVETRPFRRWSPAGGFLLGAGMGGDGNFHLLLGLRWGAGVDLWQGPAFGLEADLLGEGLIAMTWDDENEFVSDFVPGVHPMGTLRWTLWPGVDMLLRGGYRFFGRNVGAWHRPEEEEDGDFGDGSGGPGDPVWKGREPAIDLSGATVALAFRFYTF